MRFHSEMRAQSRWVWSEDGSHSPFLVAAMRRGLEYVITSHISVVFQQSPRASRRVGRWMLDGLDLAVVSLTVMAIATVFMAPLKSDIEAGRSVNWGAFIFPGVFFAGPVAFAAMSLFRDSRLLGGLKVLFGAGLLLAGLLWGFVLPTIGMLMCVAAAASMAVGIVSTIRPRHESPLR